MLIKLSVNRTFINKQTAGVDLGANFQNCELSFEDIAHELNLGHAVSQQFEGRRQNDKYSCGQIIWLDYDHLNPGDPDVIMGNPDIQEYFAFCYDSPSSTLDNPRFRLGFVLEQPIFDPDYFTRVKKAFDYHFKVDGLDMTCSDPARWWAGNKGAGVMVRDVITPMTFVTKLVKEHTLAQMKAAQPTPQTERQESSKPGFDVVAWLEDYADRNPPQNDSTKPYGYDRSAYFCTLANALATKLGDKWQAENYAADIDRLSGNKYGNRAAREVARCLVEFKPLPPTPKVFLNFKAGSIPKGNKETGKNSEDQQQQSGEANSEDQQQQEQQTDQGATEPKREKGPSQLTLLLGLLEDVELFHTSDRKKYATAEINGHRETWLIRGKEFKSLLGSRFYRQYNTAPNSQALEDALKNLEARAQFDAPEKEVHIRLAEHEGAIYLDLTNSDWQVVEITSKGWKVIDNPPVKFIRPGGMLPMANPEMGRGGRLDELLEFINCEKAEWKLLAAWIVANFNPAIPYPVCIVNGEQGSGKTDACTMIRMLLDPSKTPLRAAPKDDRDFWISSQNSRVVAYDNISGIAPWLSDALCRLATGGGSTTRLLYSDDEEAFFTARRPVLLNGIDAAASRPDLIERSILINLPVIEPEKRKAHKRVFDSFEATIPRILAGALDAVSTALANQDTTEVKSLPRMADFTLWAVAAEPAFGGEKKISFLDTYREYLERSNDLALESSVLGKIFPKWVEGFELTGYLAPSNDMLKDIENSIPDDERRKVTNQKTWPKNGRALSNALRRLAPSFRANGIKLTFDVYENNVKRGIKVEFIEVKNQTE
jgi:hypothetical protein